MTSKEAIKKIMSVLNLTNETFYEAKTDQGVSVKMEGDALEVGKMLYVATDEGMIPAPPGTHMMEDGSEVEVGDDGTVSKIKMGGMEKTDDAKKDEEQQKSTIETMAESKDAEIEMEDGDIKLVDGSVLRIGGETPEFGVNVKKVMYDGTLSAIADGAYETADGKVMQIVGGEIQGIQSKEAEMARGGKFTEAKSGDLTLDSPTFDVGETIDVVKEDGTKEKAPDGEHQIVLKDESGNENKIRVVVKDGMITERENVEEAQPETEDEMAAFVEAFATAMKRMETKLDELTNKTTVLEKSFNKFSKEPAGSPIKKQINPESSNNSTNYRLEGFKKLRETISQNN